MRHLLIVEDSALVAMNVELMAGDMGIGRVSIAPNAFVAIAMLEAGDVDVVLLDFYLGKDDGRLVAARLKELGIPYAVMTGVGDLDWLRAQVPDAPILSKPFTSEEMAAAIERLC
jgi:DNA-binding NtrC family response regulator